MKSSPYCRHMRFRNCQIREAVITIIFLMVLAHLWISVTNSLRTQRNEISISLKDISVNRSFRIAVIGDMHTREDRGALSKLRDLLTKVKESDPDLVLFLGDYTSNPRFIDDLTEHRRNVVDVLASILHYPSVFVLGNYENWSEPEKWRKEFLTSDLKVLENETQIIETKSGIICIRGLGDSFTNRFTYVDYPVGCESLPRITITHDPAGAFHSEMEGLVIAGHTHCGQVSLPLIGAIWVPSIAPRNATCGLYQDENITLYVTSGVGTSILPIRYGAQSHWDFINLTYSSD